MVSLFLVYLGTEACYLQKTEKGLHNGGRGGKKNLKNFFLKKGSTEYFRNLFSLISICQSTKNYLDWFSNMTFNFSVPELTGVEHDNEKVARTCKLSLKSVINS